MLVLGITVIGLMGLHLSQFWYKMMCAEILGQHEIKLCVGSVISPQNGAAFIEYYFSQLWVVIAYLIWYVALWFHLTHGFWSAIQTIGWSNDLWLKRWQCFSNVLSTLIVLGFAFVTLFFYAKSLCGGSCPLG